MITPLPAPARTLEEAVLLLAEPLFGAVPLAFFLMSRTAAAALLPRT